MAKRAPMDIDYSKLTLPEIIKKSTNCEASFSELGPLGRHDVFKFIAKHHINVKVFSYKWYDVLSKKFFAIEYRLSNPPSSDFVEEKKEFETFGDFFHYVDGDIYQNACCYGYNFSKEEIAQYSINLSRINFDSFIHETIDMYTFDSIKENDQEEIDSAVKRASDIAKWFKKDRDVSTLKSLEIALDEFERKFPFYESEEVFFSICLRKYKDVVKQAIIEYVYERRDIEGQYFGLILRTYGIDAALQAVDHFNIDVLSQRKMERIKNDLKDILTGIKSETYKHVRELGFSKFFQLYYVRDKYFSERCNLPFFKEYFTDFSEFVSFMNGDLSDADLSNAPISRDEVEKYKTNAQTVFPFSRHYSRYEVLKEFADGEFIVTQKWSDFDGRVMLEKRHKLIHFFDFVHFLKGDLSGADLLFCNGLENVPRTAGLKLDRAKIRSTVSEKLRLSMQLLPKGSLEVRDFDQTKKLELITMNESMAKHPENDDYSGAVNYVSDIHLLHRYQAYRCKTFDDADYVTRTIAKTLDEQAYGVNLIGGDTASDFGAFQKFVSDLSAYWKRGEFFFALGNHELWGLNEESLPSIIDQYKAVLQQEGRGHMHLVQNNLFYSDNGWHEISEEELEKITPDDLKAKLTSSFLIIFGGIGFAGKNDEFNANNGIYMNVLGRADEIRESDKFLALYKKVATALKGRSFIVLTHMPMKDWGGADVHAQDGVVYVNGHNHRNNFCDDGKKRIYADNQIGYKGKNVSFKR